MSYVCSSFYCDVCFEPIEHVNHGVLIWRRNYHGQVYEFLLVHERCDFGGKPYEIADLSTVVGRHGPTFLLSFLSKGMIRVLVEGPSCRGVTDIDAYVDLVRRVWVPHYEEARRRFNNPEVEIAFSRYDDDTPYLPSTLEHIVKAYEPQS